MPRHRMTNVGYTLGLDRPQPFYAPTLLSSFLNSYPPPPSLLFSLCNPCLRAIILQDDISLSKALAVEHSDEGTLGGTRPDGSLDDINPPHLYHLFNGCNENYESPSGAP